MDTKNRMTNYLLKAAKKHRILTYPVLALVALISVISYFFDWSKGAGKRVVAVIMVLVMLVSQSYFLTSSATEVSDDTTQQELANTAPEQTVETEPEEVVLDETIDPAIDGTPVYDEPEQTDSTEDSSVTETSQEENIPEDGSTQDVSDTSDKEDVSNEKEETTTEVGFEKEPVEAPDDAGTKTIDVVLDCVDYNQSLASIGSGFTAKSTDGGNTYDLSGAISSMKAAIQTQSNTENNCYKYSDDLYLDIHCTEKLNGSVSKNKVVTTDGNESIIVYCKKELAYYNVTIHSGSTGETGDEVSYLAGGLTTPTTLKIPASGDWNNKSATFDITKLKRYGYEVAAPAFTQADNTGSVGADGSSVTIKLTGQDTPGREVTLRWTGKKYTVLYSHKKMDTGSTPSEADCTAQTLTYGEKTNFYSQTAGGAKNYAGEDFKGWLIDGAVVTSNDLISMSYHKKLYNENFTSPIILYPKYEDASLQIDKNEVNFQYLVPGNSVVKPSFAYNGNNTEAYTLSYTIDENDKNAIKNAGITVSTDQAGIHFESTTGPTQTTLNRDPYKLKVKVSAAGKTAEEFEISVKIAPQTVNVQIPDAWRVKEYDGNANVSTSFGGNGSGKLPTSSTTPDGKSIEVSYTSATYDSASAGDNKKITISGCSMTLDSAYQDNYVLNTDNNTSNTITLNNCKIEKKLIIVRTTSSISQIRTGEPNPGSSNFRITLVNSTNFVGSDNVSALGDITYHMVVDRDNGTEREDGDTTPYKKVYVKAEGASNSNYAIESVYDYCATFEVVQEEPVLGTNYTISGSQLNDWYVGNAPLLKPIKSDTLLGGGYDQIRVSYDGGANFTAWAASVALEKTDPDYPVQVQLKSETGAITSVGNLDANYDPDGPEYLGYSFTSENEIAYNWDDTQTLNNGGLYFPSYGGVLSFGTYVKSVLHIKVKFRDDTSGLEKLHYGIFSKDVSGNTTTFDEDGVAVIEVLQSAVKDGKGVITCQAEDKAGNTSDIITLRPSGNTNDSYEWSVETREPDKCELTVTYGDDDSVAGGLRGTVTGYEDGSKKTYYRNCKATLDVVDNESGIKNVTWYVNGEPAVTQAPENSVAQKITDYDFAFGDNTVFASSSSLYTLYAVVEDNAGNTKQSKEISFFVDNDRPELLVDYKEDVNKWTSDEEITFTTSDAISDVAYAQVLKSDGTVTNINLSDPVDGVYSGSFLISGKGLYTVKVGDNAGNIHEATFNVQNISKDIPDCPEVTVLPEAGTDEEGNPAEEVWYNSTTGAPRVIIGNVTETSDKTPANTYYRHYKNDETAYDDVVIDRDETSKEIAISETDEAIHYFEYWSQSYSGVVCENKKSHVQVLRYDKSAPEVEVKNIPEESSGSNVMIRFTIKDNLSGIDKDSIAVLRNGKKFEFTLEETQDGYAGSFVVKETGNYVVTATDIAGNVAKVPGFTPMSMVVNPISNISTTKAAISARVFKGTADIGTAPTISIRKETDSKFVENANAIAEQDENGNWSVSALFEDLDENTVYIYRVLAVSDIGEVLEYQGYLRTSAFGQGGCTIRGTAGYPGGTELPSWNESGIITVGLYDGNVCVAATTVEAGEVFTFQNIPDGTYTIVATDGVYKKSQAVTVDNHIVVKPGSTISLVLSGQNTSVVITSSETPKIVADNMDSIFLYDTEVNFNDDDRALIMADGTVEFRLYATLTNVVNVSKDELAIIQRVGGSGKIVAKYLDLTLEKISTDADGNVERTRVSELANGASITITVPLQDLAGKKGIEVVRVHDGANGLEGYRYETDMDSSPYTFTFASNKFSTYAILYSPDEDGSTQQDPTDKTTTGDKTTTQDRSTQKRTTQGTTTQQHTTEDPINPPGNTAQSGSSTSFSSVRSGSGSAKTGDAAPLAAVGLLMIVSLGGVFTLRRKQK